MLLETPYDMVFDLAQRFRAMRRAKGMTMKELSESSGVPYSTIRRFEKQGEISLLSLVKMVSSLGEDSQIRGLFNDVHPASIEEVIRGNRR